MKTTVLATENTAIEVLSIVKNEGDFVTEDGRNIEFENYKAKIKIGDEKMWFRLERAYIDDMRDAVNENNLLNI